MDMVIDALDIALRRKGLSDAAASKLAVGHPSLIKNLRMPREGDKRYNWTSLEKLADVLDLELYFGPPRDTTHVPALTKAEQAAFVEVPLHEALLAAGPGTESGEAVIDRLAFRRDWLKRIGIAASAARLARVTGDSMTPSIWPGDMVLINTAITEPAVIRRTAQDRRRSPIFAFADEGGARIKRIERPAPDQLVLLSDNPEFAPEFRAEKDLSDLRIIGKVVWWGHTVRE